MKRSILFGPYWFAKETIVWHENKSGYIQWYLKGYKIFGYAYFKR